MAGFKKMMSLAFQVGAQLDPSLNKSIAEVKKLDAAMQGFEDKAARNKALNDLKTKMGEFNSATKNMGAAWGKVANDILGPVKTIAAVGTAATAAVYGLATATAKVGDDAVKAAKKVGISTQEYSKLAYAAGLSNVSQETLSTSLRKLNLNIAGAVKGNKEAQLAFKRAGVDIYDTNGKLKSTNQILLEASDTFAKMPEGIYKADLAMALFGKSGAEMVPLMEQGSAEINKLRQEAERLGIVFNDEEGAKAEGFMDSMTTLKSSIQGLGIAVGKHLHEPLTELNKVFTEWIVANREWIGLKAAEFIQEFKNHIPEIKEFLLSAKDSAVSFVKAINSIVQSMGGWESAAKKTASAYSTFSILKLVTHTLKATYTTFQFVKALGAVAPLITAMKFGSVISGFKTFSDAAKIAGLAVWNFSKSAIKSAITGLISLGTSFVGAATAAWGFTAALLANPITWVVAGVVALGAALYVLYRDWEEISSFWLDAWEDIKEAGATVADEIARSWNEVKSFFNGFINWLSDSWDLVVLGAMQTWNEFTGYIFEKIDNIKAAFEDGFLNGIAQILREFHPITILNDAINAIFGIDLLGIGKSWIKPLIDGILSGISSKASAVKDAVAGLIPQPIKSAVSSVKNAISGFAEGGIVTKPQLAVVGEAGPEAIIPLTNPNRATEIIQQVAPQLQPIQQSMPMLDSMSNVAPQIEPMQKAAAAIMPEEPTQPTPIENLSKVSNNYNNSSTSNFTFSPTINLSGGGNSADIKAAISEALNKAKNDFKSELDRWIKERDHNASRVAMA
jgi:hypothetical protein